MSKLEKIEIARIRIDGGTQSRVKIDDATVQEYTELLKSGKTLPPLDVFFDGADYWDADGFHRLHALRATGAKYAQCNVHQGTKTEAAWYASGANQTHGLKRTSADKRKAVAMALEIKPDASDSMIAEHVGVSRVIVAEVRKLTCKNLHVDSSKRTGRDGRTIDVSAKIKPVAEVDFGDAPEPQDSTMLHSFTPVEPKKPALIKPLTQEPETDGVGVPFPKYPVDLAKRYFAAQNRIKAMVNAAQQVKNDIAWELANDQTGMEYMRAQPIDNDLKNAIDQIKAGLPYAICPYCGGGGCFTCKKTGWLNRFSYQAVPESVKGGKDISEGERLFPEVGK